MTRQGIQRRSFEKAFRAEFGVSAAVAHKGRILFEKHTGGVASKKALYEHPRIAGSKVKSAKAAVARDERKKKKEKEGIAPKIPRKFKYEWKYVPGQGWVLKLVEVSETTIKPKVRHG